MLKGGLDLDVPIQLSEYIKLIDVYKRQIQPCVFQQAVGRLVYFLFRLACHGCNDQGRRVIIAHIILKNDRWAVTVLFRAGARPKMGEEDVSALEFPILLQNCTSMLLCAKPAAGCSATSFVQGMVGRSGISFRASSMVFEETAKRPSPSLSFTSSEVDRVVSLSEAVRDSVPSVSSIKKQSRIGNEFLELITRLIACK